MRSSHRCGRIPQALALCGLLVVAACGSAGPAVPADVEAERLRLENERLRSLLATEVQVECSPEEARRGETVEVLLADIFFESGSVRLTGQGQTRLDALADKLRREFAGRTVRVEGHTDTQPIGPTLQGRFPTNWELSVARAAAVVRYLLEVHGLDPARMEAVGFGPHDPVDSNDTAEGRARNRRVRVAVLPTD